MTLTPTTRASLLLRLRDPGDHEAWVEFVSLYEPVIYRVLRRSSLQDADAREVLQELFLAVNRNIDRWQHGAEHGSFRGWLRRVTRNLVVSWVRRQRRQVTTSAVDLDALLESTLAVDGWRVGVSPVPATIAIMLEQTSQRLRLRQSVQILQSTLTPVPIVVGYLRPVILLPVSVIAGIPASQLEAILAHELAHVRRHDFLINLLQTLIETLFFYHPAVWWLSHRIRIERENCCDDLAVTALGNRVEYGRALLAIEELRGKATTLALGVKSGSLLDRVQCGRAESVGSA